MDAAGDSYDGCRFLRPSANPADADWENVRGLWAEA